MSYRKVQFPKSDALELSEFKEMDYFTVQNYNLPIELMMENAGLQLANLVVASTAESKATILIGVGNGNNGGGGLVAARRLAAWGYHIYLDINTNIDRELPKRQLDRALSFGAKREAMTHPEIWVDAYLGFSQRLPLPENLISKIQQANDCDCHRISLDVPTGFLGDPSTTYFHAEKVLSLATSKKILYNLPESTAIYIADLGIPKEVYQKFGVNIPPFHTGNILKIER